MRNAILALLLAVAPYTERAALVGGNTSFALELYKREAAQTAGNVFFSPYSISLAMGMVEIGTRGTTESEIDRALRFPFGGDRLARAWHSLIDDVNHHSGQFQLVTANALWAQRNTPFRDSYLDLARRDFGARIETLDFARAPDAARGRINAWVSDATHAKIPELIAPGVLDAQTQLVLTNAIYMKATWLRTFDAANTNDKGRFHAAGGDVTVPMMSKRDGYRYVHADGVRMLELPYRDRELSMLVILPDANNGLGAIEKTLTPERLASWESRMEPAEVDVALPRFHAEESYELRDALKAMGVVRALDRNGRGDFSGMTEKRKLAISRVIHKARVDVTEEGTEAAAATAIGIAATSAMISRPEQFIADHPFLFLIRRNGSKSVLFIGRLARP
jgi:serpin B